MGVTSYSHELNCLISPGKLFEVLFLDHEFCPKLVPHAIKSVDIKGDGGAGTIIQISYSETVDSKDMKHLKNRIDVLDKENFYCKYTSFEGDEFPNGLEKIVNEVKLEDSSNGGCISKTVSHYHLQDGVEINEEEIKACKSKRIATYKVVEAYLTETKTPKFSVSFFLPQ